jgi:transcriptional regulator with XRE-family HTH domain
MSQPNWSRIERGEANITLELITRVSDLLGMSVTELVGQSAEAKAGLESMGVKVLFDKPSKGGDVGMALLTGAALGFLIAQVLRK